MCCVCLYRHAVFGPAIPPEEISNVSSSMHQVGRGKVDIAYSVSGSILVLTHGYYGKHTSQDPFFAFYHYFFIINTIVAKQKRAKNTIVALG